MYVPVSQAKAQLTDLIKRAERGEEVIVTRHGRPIIRFQPAARKPQTAAERLAILQSIQQAAIGKALPGPDAARSQDFLYDEDGLPA